jgi:kynurenine 3-monooxygenase
VTFSNIRYSVAYKQGQLQNEIMDQIMEMPEIEKNWDNEQVMNRMLELSQDFNF